VETYLDISGLAKYLGVAEKTVRKWVLNREMPYCKIMKVIRFRVSEIEAWINSGGKHCPISDAEAGEAETPEQEGAE
jgi:excisionase family DNA binding protein